MQPHRKSAGRFDARLFDKDGDCVDDLIDAPAAELYGEISFSFQQTKYVLDLWPADMRNALLPSAQDRAKVNAEYIRSRACPHCRSEHITRGLVNGDSLTRPVSCDECAEMWDERFAIVGIQNFGGVASKSNRAQARDKAARKAPTPQRPKKNPKKPQAQKSGGSEPIGGL